MAVISPEELALQPLHVVLILFIVALAAFIALILRAVWGKGLSTMNRFADCLDKLTKMIDDVGTKIEQLQEDQNKSLRDYQNLSLDALKAKSSKNEDLTEPNNKRKH
jgi:predicted PurR-regulated permease PerM